ncbi:MAG: acetyl-CoA carboxylase biotin carboxyl carrier protein subunit [Bdellovibrionales bacterium]|nr:acetyl-CoA carboxylase biotin carboxyl carrier protein subunit [Bdellovibrionales bacterium]
MKKIPLVVDGQSLEIWAERLGKDLWYHYNGESFVYRPEEKRRKSTTAKISQSQVTAPMPGKIIKVHVSLGDTVIEGQALVVMEAMKMEYTLEAQMSGHIEAVNCREGDQVMLGKELIKLK